MLAFPIAREPDSVFQLTMGLWGQRLLNRNCHCASVIHESLILKKRMMKSDLKGNWRSGGKLK